MLIILLFVKENISSRKRKINFNKNNIQNLKKISHIIVDKFPNDLTMERQAFQREQY